MNLYNDIQRTACLAGQQ